MFIIINCITKMTNTHSITTPDNIIIIIIIIIIDFRVQFNRYTK
jgi:hypothetical protein